MRLVFFSDIHGNKYAFDVFLEAMDHESPDKIYFLGDVFGYYYYSHHIIDGLQKNKIECLLGNHDKMLIDLNGGSGDVDILSEKYGSVYKDYLQYTTTEDLKWLAGLCAEKEFVTDGLSFYLAHGTPADPLNGRLYPDGDTEVLRRYAKYDYIILGHTHHKMIKRCDNTVIVNPGSLGQQRDGKGCSYLVIDTAKGNYSFNIIEYDTAKLLSDIEKNDPGNTKLSEVILRKR